MSKRRLIISLIVMVVVILLGRWMVYYTQTFPYGSSHCCIIQFICTLEQYAEENGGKYPAGESSPEASLSLLYKSNGMPPDILRGMTVPEKTVRRILEGGGLLGPDSCGWHYVPGLTRADDQKLALLWCKSALGHNGQRTKDGSREILFVGGRLGLISGDEWPAFLQEQEDLLKLRSAKALEGVPLVTWSIELPDGSRSDRADSPYTLKEESKDIKSSASGTGTSSGTKLSRSALLCWQAPLQNGTVTRTLSFSNMVSDPVTVTFTEGVPNVTNPIFVMRKSNGTD